MSTCKRLGRRAAALASALALLAGSTAIARDFFMEEGTEIAVRLRTSIEAKSNQKGDRVICTVEEGVVIDNVEVIPIGARVHGRIGDIQKAGRFGRGGQLVLAFESIEVPGAGQVPINGSVVDLYDPEDEEDRKQTKDLDLGKEGEIKAGGASKVKRIGTIAGGAGAGAAVGGGTGAAIGVAAGTAAAFIFWKGKEVNLPAGTGLVIRIDRGVALSVPDMPKAVGDGTRPRSQ